jgi:hypothetical protein
MLDDNVARCRRDREMDGSASSSVSSIAACNRHWCNLRYRARIAAQLKAASFAWPGERARGYKLRETGSARDRRLLGAR